MRHIVDITNGDDEYAPHVSVGIQPWRYEQLQQHVDETYLIEERTLAVRDWPEDACREAIIRASLKHTANRRAQVEANLEKAGDLKLAVRNWVRWMLEHDDYTTINISSQYRESFAEVAKEYGLEY